MEHGRPGVVRIPCDKFFFIIRSMDFCKVNTTLAIAGLIVAGIPVIGANMVCDCQRKEGLLIWLQVRVGVALNTYHSK